MATTKKSIKPPGVYLAKTIARDINRVTSHIEGAERRAEAGKRQTIVADPIDDLIARALADGRLPARDSTGRPISTPKLPSDFRTVYVAPSEVNKILAEARYLEQWDPKPVYPRRPQKETPAERAKNYGWEVVVREEATRHFTDVKKRTRQELTQAALARYLRKWVVEHGINSQRGIPPGEGSIRNQLQPRYWKRT